MNSATTVRFLSGGESVESAMDDVLGYEAKIRAGIRVTSITVSIMRQTNEPRGSAFVSKTVVPDDGVPWTMEESSLVNAVLSRDCALDATRDAYGANLLSAVAAKTELTKILSKSLGSLKGRLSQVVEDSDVS